MNPLVKKEIRLLLPSWIVAMLLALIQASTRPYDFYVACLLFFGLTIMALTTIGRESSLNTFSSLLAQPAERLRIWQTKITVLAIAFLMVFGVWLLAFGLALKNPSVDASSREDSYNIFITICLIATATFTGGLWTTLLIRQVAGAFWLTLLVPATLSGFSGAFLAPNQSNNLLIAVLCVVFAVYSIGGFLFARWLFFRAQDVGWSGGVIALPEWKFFAARTENAISTRTRKPIFALIKKEFQLQQASLMGAVGLLALHIGVIVLRKYHPFAKNSAGEFLTAIFWMLWLVMVPVIGSMAVAEERRLGVMEGQLCLPVSRRVQFAIKGFLTLFLGTFLGGVMPMLLEDIGIGFGAQNPVFMPEVHTGEFGILLFQLGFVAFVAWLVLVSFFASTLARSFLQAVGLAIATFFGCLLLIPIFTSNRMILFDSISVHSILPLVITVPTLIVTLLWLAYLNFKNFRDGWPLWRRNLLGFAGAFVFIVVTTIALYHRAWEIFEPAEPAHGAAKLSLANPPALQMVQYRNLLVRLPDGRVWFDCLGDSYNDFYDDPAKWRFLWRTVTHPLRKSIGPQQFLAGSNWVAATTERLYLSWNVKGKQFFASGFMDTVGIQPDGTLWLSENPDQNKWTAGTLQQYGSETNWRQLAQSHTSVVLLKSDGTLWRWGSVTTVTNELHQWPGLRAFTPDQIGTNSDWQELFTLGWMYARRTDGRVWRLDLDWKTGRDELNRATNCDGIVSQTASHAGDQTAFVRADGTLWMLNRYWDEKTRQTMGTGILQVGKENDWRAVAVNQSRMVALKSDGSLWLWHFLNPWDMSQEQLILSAQEPPTRLGIHNDWVAIASTWEDVIALAADGSLWLWPDHEQYERYTLLKLPKQPRFLGNVFGKSD
jgi:hypothetical protein